MVDGERRLWQAVLEKAIDDTLHARFSPYLLRRHLNWFREDNRDFQFVCSLADSDPETIRNLLMTLLKKGDDNDIRTFTKSVKNFVTGAKTKNQKRKKRKKREKRKK
jgi:hypothetical protein